MRLDGRSAIVTGGGLGIGRAITLRLLSEGASVVAVDREPNNLEQLAKDADGIGGRLELLELDVTGKTAPQQSMERALSKFGKLDILVNNAGRGNARPMLETTDEYFDLSFEVNVRTTFRFCREAIPLLTDTRGCIVSLSSVTALMGDAGNSPYAAGKAAVAGLTRQLAAEYGPRGIRINAVAPALTETPATRERIYGNKKFLAVQIGGNPMLRPAKPDEIAAPVVFLCSDDASYINGQVLAVDGGFSTTKFRSFEARFQVTDE